MFLDCIAYIYLSIYILTAVVSSEVDGEEAKSSGSTSELIPNFDEVNFPRITRTTIHMSVDVVNL